MHKKAQKSTKNFGTLLTNTRRVPEQVPEPARYPTFNTQARPIPDFLLPDPSLILTHSPYEITPCHPQILITHML